MSPAFASLGVGGVGGVRGAARAMQDGSEEAPRSDMETQARGKLKHDFVAEPAAEADSQSTVWVRGQGVLVKKQQKVTHPSGAEALDEGDGAGASWNSGDEARMPNSVATARGSAVSISASESRRVSPSCSRIS